MTSKLQHYIDEGIRYQKDKDIKDITQSKDRLIALATYGFFASPITKARVYYTVNEAADKIEKINYVYNRIAFPQSRVTKHMQVMDELKKTTKEHPEHTHADIRLC